MPISFITLVTVDLRSSGGLIACARLSAYLHSRNSREPALKSSAGVSLRLYAMYLRKCRWERAFNVPLLYWLNRRWMWRGLGPERSGFKRMCRHGPGFHGFHVFSPAYSSFAFGVMVSSVGFSPRSVWRWVGFPMTSPVR